MAKHPQELEWIEELLPTGYIRKPMFGGFAYYLNDKLILTLFESPGDKSYKNLKFEYDIWNGCMFPCERDNHKEILALYPFLVNHPVLPKWLYLPVQSEDFDTNAELILRELRRHSPLFGTIPKPKKRKVSTKRTPHRKEKPEKIDTRFPRMFSDEPTHEILSKAKNISDLKNLGPSSEAAFHKAGIKTAKQFIKMGWKKALIKLVKTDKRNRHSIFAYALIGALKNLEWNVIPEQDKQEARDFVKSLRKKNNV